MYKHIWGLLMKESGDALGEKWHFKHAQNLPLPLTNHPDQCFASLRRGAWASERDVVVGAKKTVLDLCIRWVAFVSRYFRTIGNNEQRLLAMWALPSHRHFSSPITVATKSMNDTKNNKTTADVYCWKKILRRRSSTWLRVVAPPPPHLPLTHSILLFFNTKKIYSH